MYEYSFFDRGVVSAWILAVLAWHPCSRLYSIRGMTLRHEFPPIKGSDPL